MARCKNDIFYADADTIILSCNGHPLNISMVGRQSINLAMLRQEFPKEVEIAVAEIPFDDVGVNENVRLEVEAAPVAAPKMVRTPTTPPDGYKVMSAYDISWCENLETHKPLGWSGSRKDKTLGKVIARSGDAVVERVQKTDMKRG